TSSSRSRSRNFWRASKHWRDAAPRSSRKLSYASAISSSTSCRGRRTATDGKSSCCRANIGCSNISCATRDTSFHWRCCCSTYGICTSTRRPTLSTSTSAACAARLTLSRPIRSFIRSAVSGTTSVLLVKTLRSSTLKLALACIGIFGAVVFALFGYVYWSTVSHIRGRADHAVAAEYSVLQDAFDAAGRRGLVAAIEQRIAEQRL